MDGNVKVWIFYSPATEPELLAFYADGLAYLRDQEDIELEVVDIDESPGKTEEFDVKSTPTVLVEKAGEVIQREGVTGCLNGILERKELKNIVEKY